MPPPPSPPRRSDMRDVRARTPTATTRHNGRFGSVGVNARSLPATAGEETESGLSTRNSPSTSRMREKRAGKEFNHRQV